MALQVNHDHEFHYVSAIYGSQRFLLAGPYSCHEAAAGRVRAVRVFAMDNDRTGKAAFAAYGTASSSVRHAAALGAHMGRHEDLVTDDERQAIQAAIAARQAKDTEDLMDDFNWTGSRHHY